MPGASTKRAEMKKTTKQSAKSTKAAARKRAATKTAGFTDAEKAAMKERSREVKAEARAGKNKADGERVVLTKIDELPEPDRTLGRSLHAIVMANAPDLSPKLWYGMPAYAGKDGKVVCFFQAAAKFKTRYATFAFTDAANLDDGAMWPTGFGLRELSAGSEAKIGALVKKAVAERSESA